MASGGSPTCGRADRIRRRGMAPRRPVGYRPLLLGRRFRCSRARKSSLRRDIGYHGRLPPLHPRLAPRTPSLRSLRPSLPVLRARCVRLSPVPPRIPKNAGDRRPTRHNARSGCHGAPISCVFVLVLSFWCSRSYALVRVLSCGCPPPGPGARSLAAPLCSANQPREIAGPPAAHPQHPAARTPVPVFLKTQEIAVPRATTRTGDATTHVSPAFSFERFRSNARPEPRCAAPHRAAVLQPSNHGELRVHPRSTRNFPQLAPPSAFPRKRRRRWSIAPKRMLGMPRRTYLLRFRLASPRHATAGARAGPRGTCRQPRMMSRSFSRRAATSRSLPWLVGR